MATVSIGACISSAVDDLKKDPVTHIAAPLVIAVISSFTFYILTGPLLVGYFKMLDRARQGEQVAIGDLFKGFDVFVPALVATLLGGVAVSIGSVLCVIPGLLIAPLVPVAALLVARGEQDGVNALKRAWELIKSQLVMAAVAIIVLQLVAGLGVIACFIGVLVTAPIGSLGSYYLASQLAE